jgi:hypothetical protein
VANVHVVPAGHGAVPELQTRSCDRPACNYGRQAVAGHQYCAIMIYPLAAGLFGFVSGALAHLLLSALRSDDGRMTRWQFRKPALAPDRRIEHLSTLLYDVMETVDSHGMRLDRLERGA